MSKAIRAIIARRTFSVFSTNVESGFVNEITRRPSFVGAQVALMDTLHRVLDDLYVQNCPRTAEVCEGEIQALINADERYTSAAVNGLVYEIREV